MTIKNKKSKKRAGKPSLATASCSQLVMPAGYAEMYLSECDGPYRRVFRSSVKRGGEWAYFYKGRKRVWDCNPGVARKHFYTVSANVEARDSAKNSH